MAALFMCGDEEPNNAKKIALDLKKALKVPPESKKHRFIGEYALPTKLSGVKLLKGVEDR